MQKKSPKQGTRIGKIETCLLQTVPQKQHHVKTLPCNSFQKAQFKNRNLCNLIKKSRTRTYINLQLLFEKAMHNIQPNFRQVCYNYIYTYTLYSIAYIFSEKNIHNLLPYLFLAIKSVIHVKNSLHSFLFKCFYCICKTLRSEKAHLYFGMLFAI